MCLAVERTSSTVKSFSSTVPISRMALSSLEFGLSMTLLVLRIAEVILAVYASADLITSRIEASDSGSMEGLPAIR
jgi:hypothetical protein